jgi:hypothetical protein
MFFIHIASVIIIKSLFYQKLERSTKLREIQAELRERAKSFLPQSSLISSIFQMQ